jgi:Flp pilus assembly protein TadG
MFARTPSIVRRRSLRRGIKVLELILVTPIILLALVGTLEYGLLNINHAAVTHAATVGAREAGKLDPQNEIQLMEVVGRVNQILAANDIVITGAAGSGTRLVIQDGADSLNPLVFGDPNMTCTPPVMPALELDEVRVTLCIDFSATKLNGTPVIDAFDYCGFTFDGKRFQVSSLGKKELN